jgi:RNA polymerase sigma factor (sigma-70 family)
MRGVDLDFDQLYRDHREGMLSYALRMLNLHVPSAQDAVAQAWLWAWEQRHEYRDRGPGPKPWLLTLTRYAALTLIRDRWTPINLPGTEEEEHAPFHVTGTGYPGLEDPQTHAAWAEVMPYLTEQEAVAVWLKHIGGYTPDEAAREMGVTKTVAQLSADQGLRKIRRYFQPPGFRFQRGCRNCGWHVRTLGHRLSCPS